jgi:hypothetical protein
MEEDVAIYTGLMLKAIPLLRLKPRSFLAV